MTLRNLGTVSKDFFVIIPGVKPLVRPSVETLGERAADIPRLLGKEGLKQLYTPAILKIYEELKKGKKDSFSKLSEKQPLVRAEAVEKDKMAEILDNFWDEISREYAIWAELLHGQPEKIGFKMPKGHSYNAALIQNWYLPESGGIEDIDVSKATFSPVNWPEKTVKANKRMIKQLNLPKDLQKIIVYSDKERAIENYNCYDALLWDFRRREGPDLDSYWGPLGRYYVWGSLSGREVDAYKMTRDIKK